MGFQHRPWSKEEEDWLRRVYHDLPGVFIAGLLNRTPRAVSVRASRLGLRGKHRPGYTVFALSKALGVHYCQVYRWVESGLLRARRHPAPEGAGEGAHYRIHRRDVVDFIRAYFLLYDPAKLREPWRSVVPHDQIAAWISVTEAVRRYHYSRQWFYELIWNGALPARQGLRPREPGSRGYVAYVRPVDIEAVEAQIAVGTGLPFGRNGRPRGGYVKGKGPRGWHVETAEQRRNRAGIMRRLGSESARAKVLALVESSEGEQVSDGN